MLFICRLLPKFILTIAAKAGCYFVRAPGFWCWGLFTTEILRDFSGEDDALESQEGEDHPLSLMSLKRTRFGFLRELVLECVLSMFGLFFMLILP